MSDWEYKLYLHDELVCETDLRGIAHIQFEGLKLLGLAELREVYRGNNFDPVLHSTIVHRGGIYPLARSTHKVVNIVNLCPWILTR